MGAVGLNGTVLMRDPRPARPARRFTAVLKVAVALAAIVGLGYLFVQSASDVRAEPYTMPRAHLQGWTLWLEPGARPTDPMLALRPRAELVHGLFRQVFARAMESMYMSETAAIPVLLQGEFDRAFAGRVPPAALLAAGREAGLETATIEPTCIGYERHSEPGSIRQLYYAVFDAPAVLRFRQDLVQLVPAGPAPSADFDPAAQSPVLFISTAGQAFSGWLPMRVNPETDCVAPIVVE